METQFTLLSPLGIERMEKEEDEGEDEVVIHKMTRCKLGLRGEKGILCDALPCIAFPYKRHVVVVPASFVLS